VSLVVACPGEAAWLPEFLASAERRLTDAVEVVLVIDGSPDPCDRLADARPKRPTHRVVVIEQHRRGAAEARNAGLRAASGAWVSFPDPDDVPGRRHLRRVFGFLASPASDCACLVSTDDAAVTGTTHSPGLRWPGRVRTVDLDDEPDFIRWAIPSCFFRRDRLEVRGLRFDRRMPPAAADAHLVARYLLAEPHPTVALLPGTRRLHRRRGVGRPSGHLLWSSSDTCDDVLRFGHLDLLDTAAAAGRVPRWLENAVLDDLSWYFTMDARGSAPTSSPTAEQQEIRHESLRRILHRISPDAIAAYAVTPLPDEIRSTFLALRGALPVPAAVRVRDRDIDQHLTAVSYFVASPAFTGEESDSAGAPTFTVDGRPVPPTFTKRRSVVSFGRPLLTEVTHWLPGVVGTVAARCGATAIAVAPDTGRRRLSRAVAEMTGVSGPVRQARVALALARRQRSAFLQAAVTLDNATSHTGTGPARPLRLFSRFSRFRDCWLLIDRDTEAHDNAEHLYRYLRAQRPDINAWFVLNRRSPDWPRLKADGFRLIRHGSAAQALALTQCRELISSQIDHYIVSPLAVIWLRRRPWRFTWLQHGVIQSDLSRWLNTKTASTVVTTTKAEYESIAGDDTPYAWGRREVVHTGQPRHDALFAKARSTPAAARTWLVVMPTWRRDLLSEGANAGNGRAATADFWESDYARNWLGLLQAPAVAAAAQRHGLQIVAMPHPNMTPHLTPDRLPPHVRLADYSHHDVQDVLARASHLVTDYSSNAFEAAMIDRPVLYFQFDRDHFLDGRHIGRQGYFDYARDGFGPVTTSLEDAIAALVALLETGIEPREPYASRIRTTFTLPDTGACARVLTQIERARSAQLIPTRNCSPSSTP